MNNLNKEYIKGATIKRCLDMVDFSTPYPSPELLSFLFQELDKLDDKTIDNIFYKKEEDE